MLSVKSSTAGKVVLPIGGGNSETSIMRDPLASDDSSLIKPYSDTPPSESTRELLTAIFLALETDDLERCPSDKVGPAFWDQFCQMTLELDSQGLLSDRRYSLSHLDLAPRKILVNPTAGLNSPIISAILDWYSAVFAPISMTCSPPMWIYTWNEDEDEGERMANDIPPFKGGRELKPIFDEVDGEEYIKLAYELAYRLARRLISFAMEGIRYNEDFKDAEATLR